MKKIITLIIITTCIKLVFGQCDPTSLNVSNITANSALLSWTAPAASSFSVKWKTAGTPGWNPSNPGIFQTLYNINNDTILFDTLSENTNYEWRIRPFGCNPTTNWFSGPAFTTLVACNKSVNQHLTGFDINPIYQKWVWTYDTLSITNTSNCDIRIRPEFDISHDSLPIAINDFDLKWYNPYIGNWPDLTYYIDANGHAVGFWAFGSDSTGINITQGSIQQVIIRIRFRTNANYGKYTASWQTQEVDMAGNFLQTLGSGITTSIDLVDCSIYNIDSTSSTNISCFGNNNGSAKIISVQNGSGATLFKWSNGETTNTINNLTPGNYECIVIDSNWQNCADTINFTISEPPALSAIENITDVICFGDSNGVATIEINGGSPPYTEVWSTTSQFNLPAGDYFYTVIDSNGCSFSDSITITQPPLLTSIINSTDITNCNIDDGTIDLTVNGGAGNYNYNWSNNATSQDLNSLSEGNYIVTINDSNNCSITNNAIINNYISNITTTLSSPTFNGFNIQCFGDNNGTIYSNTTGEVGPLIYAWSNGQSNVDATNLYAGNYSLIVTDSLGCDATANINLTEPAELTSSYTQNNVSCFGANNGGVIVNFFGGVTDYILSWDTLTYPLIGGISSFTNPVGIPAGVYPYSVFDANLCSIYDTITITQPNELELSLSTSIICCNGDSSGIVNSNINGGTLPYTYNWNNGDTTQNINNIIADTYTLIVTDNNNCNIQDSITVSENPPLIATYSKTDLICYGDNNACIYTSVTGGAGNYTYSWNTGDNTASICNLTAGIYTCLITDACGCTTTISATITEPDELTSNYNKNDVSCFGANDGSAVVNFFGGTIGTNIGDTNYILGWDGLTTVLYNPIAEFQTAAVSPAGVPAGIYPYSVTDLNGCTIYDTITITEPDSMYITYSTSDYNGFNISCFGFSNGSINIQVNGGSAPFNNYLNSTLQTNLVTNNLTAGSYIDSIVDANGCTATNNIILSEPNELITTLSAFHISCNGICDGEVVSNSSGGVLPYSFLWSNGDTISSITNLCAGSQNVIVTDINNCTTNTNINVIEPNPITFNIDSLFNISTYGGNDGAIYISASGGVGSLDYYWSDALSFSSNNEDIESITAGSYLLTVTDTNSCILDTLIELTQPSSLILNLDSIYTVSCFDSCDASIFITAIGGDSSYSYSWIGPNGFTENNPDISNLCFGEYIITIDDGISTLIDTFNVYQPQPIITDLTVDSILCYNGFAQAEINVWGGTQPFSYNWSNGDTNYFTYLNNGNYTINVIDNNGCFLSQSFSLNHPDSILTQVISNPVSCYGFADGSSSISIISGGINPYFYSNNNGQTYQSSNIFNNLQSGNYNYSIMDANGCESTISSFINSPNEITSITSVIDVSCYDACDGEVDVIASGGTPPYTYTWNTGVSNLCAGPYDVTISDLNGCLSNNLAIVNQPNPLPINIWLEGTNLQATSGFNSYQWYDENNNPIVGATDSIFSPNSQGIYYVEVSDTNGCFSFSYDINYNINLIYDIINSIVIFPNPSNGKITIESKNNNIDMIKIYNNLGNQLHLVNNKNDIQKITEIDLSTFAKGFYFLKIYINNQIITQRIVLQ